MTHRGPLLEAQVETALSTPAYRRILAVCIRRPLSVKDIAQQTGIPLASVYRNVRALETDALLVVERSAMTAEGKPYDLYRSRLREANMRISASGVELGWQVESTVEDRLIHLWNYLGA